MIKILSMLSLYVATLYALYTLTTYVCVCGLRVFTHSVENNYHQGDIHIASISDSSNRENLKQNSGYNIMHRIYFISNYR